LKINKKKNEIDSALKTNEVFNSMPLKFKIKMQKIKNKKLNKLETKINLYLFKWNKIKLGIIERLKKT
jgi:hypothetical protein